MSLREFLKRAKEWVNEAEFIWVSGNDSAETGERYVPVIKVSRDELSLRPELEYVLNQVGLDLHSLLCSDSIGEQKERVILIDHNVASAPWEDRAVIGVLDHHVDEGKYKTCEPREIQMVGSCVSLVLARFPKVELERVTARLALAPLLVDTINLRWDLGRTTEADEATLERLKTWAEDREGYFRAIEEVKRSVEGLCNRDLLRKDYKGFCVGPYRIGTCAVTWSFEAWFEREGSSGPVTESVNRFAKERNLDLVIVLTAFDDQGQYRRQLALFVYHPDLKPLMKAVQTSSDLQLVALDTDLYYQQLNIKMSRKQVWPWIQHWLQTEWVGHNK